MATVEQRYQSAVAYVERAISTVEKGNSSWNPVSNAIERYAGKTKTSEPRNDLQHIKDRWAHATSDVERARIARDAELLADRTQESLPGAPQDRQRTNLFKNETPTSTPATSYGDEAKREAAHAVHWVREKAHAVAEAIDPSPSIGTWLLIGGGVVAAILLLRSNDREQRQANARTINRRLARIANDQRGEL